MIRLLVGENSFEREAALQTILSERTDVDPERYDGSTLTTDNLPDLFMGQTLFAQKRLIIIRDAHENSQFWQALPDWVETMSDDTLLILNETTCDKRSKLYKLLKKNNQVQEFTPWSDYDTKKAETWLINEAKKKGIALSAPSAQLIRDRVGMNQWYLSEAVEKISLFGRADRSAIEQVIEPSPSSNVFLLFETALKKDRKKLTQLLEDLSISQDAHMTIGLLAGQAIQLAALAVSRSENNVAKDFGVHPYAVQKLRPYAARLGAAKAAIIVREIAKADEQAKSANIPVWTIIGQTMMRIASIK